MSLFKYLYLIMMLMIIFIKMFPKSSVLNNLCDIS